MRSFTARSLALAALVPALFVLSVIPGCSNESEGERCGDPGGALSTDNSDCADGLVCVPIPLASGSNDSVNRCCYADHVSDARCARNTGVNATGSGGGPGSSNNDAGASATEAGTSSVPAGGGASMTADPPVGAGGA